MGARKTINVARVTAARRCAPVRVGWPAIMIRAVGLLSQQWPQLRQSYLPFPWPRIYQHPICIPTLAVEREWRGERAVFFNPVVGPERRRLPRIDHYLRFLRTAPIAEVGGYRRLIWASRLPQPVRGLLWRLVLHWSGRLRSRYIGTINVNPVTERHLEALQIAAPISFVLYFCAPTPKGEMALQIFFDHRVIDGMMIGRLIVDLEKVLSTALVAELEQLSIAPPVTTARDPIAR